MDQLRFFMSEQIPLKGLQSSLSDIHSYAEKINDKKTDIPIQEVLNTLQNTLQKLDDYETEGFLSPKIAKDISTVQTYINDHLENDAQANQSEKVQGIYDKISARLNIKPSS